jgi:hypothetical protein
VGEVECFDEVPCRADLSRRASSEESAQLLMYRLGTVLWHRLKASERAKLPLSLENMFHDFGP